MLASRRITFVVAVKSKGPILARNLLASPCLSKGNPHRILVQENFPSAARAYNNALARVADGVVVFVHQDIILPEEWISQLYESLDWLNVNDANWGVLGCGGVGADGEGRGHIFSSGVGLMGRPFPRPMEVRTLDEIVLILRKSSGLRFDEQLPHFHFYGTDICLRAAKLGMKSYAIPAFCVHNTHQSLVLPDEFYDCYRQVKRTWRDHLPIQTTCIKVTKYDLPLYARRLREKYLRYIRRKEVGGNRADDIAQLLAHINTLRRQFDSPFRT